MWAQRLIAPERFERCEVATPSSDALTDGEVLLRIQAGGICGSDLPFFRGATSPDGSATAHGFGQPGFPLHEVVGVVVGSRHPDHSVGQQVVGWSSKFDAIAEYTVTDGNGLASYDPALSPEFAILLQPLACVLYAVEQMGDVAGRRVAVLGQGPIGLLFSHVMHSRGADHVIGVDRIDRVDLGKQFGVDEVVHASTDRWAQDLAPSERPHQIVEAIGHQSATVNHAIDAAAFGGRIFYFGIPDELTYPVNMRSLLRKNLTLQSGVTLERRRMLADADAYLGEYPELADAYITDVLPADSADSVTEAFIRAQRPSPRQAKIVIQMP